MKKHLLEGVKKGAFDEAEAEKRFQTWLTSKQSKIQAKIDGLKGKVAADAQASLDRVITSYSIHYTKLYDTIPVPAPQLLFVFIQGASFMVLKCMILTSCVPISITKRSSRSLNKDLHEFIRAFISVVCL